MAWGAYEKQQGWYTKKDMTMSEIMAAHLPGWNLVAQTQQDTLEAVDNIWLAQDTQSLDCVIAFEGTHTFAEFFGNLKSPKNGYCGFPGVHAGYADKLFWLMKYSMPKLRPFLSKCNKAAAGVGFDFGLGATTQCAKGRFAREAQIIQRLSLNFAQVQVQQRESRLHNEKMESFRQPETLHPGSVRR